MAETIKFYEIGFSVANQWSVVATYIDGKRAVEAIPEHAKDCLQSIAEKLTVKEVQKERIYKGDIFFGQDRWGLYLTYAEHPLCVFDTVDSCEIHAAKLIEAKPASAKYLYIK